MTHIFNIKHILLIPYLKNKKNSIKYTDESKQNKIIIKTKTRAQIINNSFFNCIHINYIKYQKVILIELKFK